MLIRLFKMFAWSFGVTAFLAVAGYPLVKYGVEHFVDYAYEKEKEERAARGSERYETQYSDGDSDDRYDRGYAYDDYDNGY